MHSCMTDEPRAYSILTTSTAYMHRFHASQFFTLLKLHDKDCVPLYFKSKLIKYVQEHLGKAPVDMRIFRAVYSPTTSESFNGDLDEGKTHMTALVAIIYAMGGLDALGPYFKERTVQCDLYIAALSFSPPLITPTYDPDPLSLETAQKVFQQPRGHHYGDGFREDGGSRIIDPRMRGILIQLIVVVHVTVDSWSRQGLSVAELLWLACRRSAMCHGLLSPPTACSSSESTASAQKCIRLAAMFFTEMILADKLSRKSSFSHWNHRL